MSTWDPIVRKVESRLAIWKRKLISQSGRLTLIKSVLNSLPLYCLSLFRIPVSVAKKLRQLQCRFFWGGDENSNRIANVSWDVA